ncbi:MAG: tetratricopeptide repeat protein [Clostridium sp.]
MKEVAILLNHAQEMIKAKDYNTAKLALVKALKYDPFHDKTYLLLGNVFYLLRMDESACKSYLATIHLQIRKLKNLKEQSIEAIIDNKYKNLPPETKELLPCKYGAVIFDDNIIPNHIAHAYIDFNINGATDPLLEECSELYRESLVKQSHPKNLISNYNICYEDYLSFEESHFVSLGRSFLIDSINWDNIDSKDVKYLYFSKGY